VSQKRTPPSLALLREQIDRLDAQILTLLNRRARLAARIGQTKRQDGDGVYVPGRERQVLARLAKLNQGPLPNEAVWAIYREIISASRALEQSLRIAYLGPPVTFTHLAAREHFGSQAVFVPVPTIPQVFAEVEHTQADYGVVPVENSSDGRVADTLDMFMRLPHLVICAEVRLRVHHNLMARCSQQEIRRVYSKGQALSQCRNWLSKNVPQASLHEVSSTAAAAQLALTEPGAAAVASRQAAVRYNLRILFSEIEDSPYNETRFAVIGHQKCEPTGHDKTTVMFRIPHSSGSLVAALDVFKQAKMNLTWIESFPARTPKPEYVFFVEFEGHAEEPKVGRALKALQEHCQEMTVLGSFPMALTAG